MYDDPRDKVALLEKYVVLAKEAERITDQRHQAGVVPVEGLDLEAMINAIEKDLLLKALERAKWVKKKAARLLRLNTRSFRYRLEKYAIKGGRD